MTRSPAVQLHATCRVRRDDVDLAPRRRPRRDYSRHGELKSSRGTGKKYMRRRPRNGTNHVNAGIFTGPNTYNPAGNLRAAAMSY